MRQYCRYKHVVTIMLYSSLKKERWPLFKEQKYAKSTGESIISIKLLYIYFERSVNEFVSFLILNILMYYVLKSNRILYCES